MAQHWYKGTCTVEKYEPVEKDLENNEVQHSKEISSVSKLKYVIKVSSAKQSIRLLMSSIV